MIKAFQDLLDDLFETVFIQYGGELIHHENVVFEFVDQIVFRPGHELYYKTAGGFDGEIGVHQDAKRAG